MPPTWTSRILHRLDLISCDYAKIDFRGRFRRRRYGQVEKSNVLLQCRQKANIKIEINKIKMVECIRNEMRIMRYTYTYSAFWYEWFAWLVHDSLIHAYTHRLSTECRCDNSTLYIAFNIVRLCGTNAFPFCSSLLILYLYAADYDEKQCNIPRADTVTCHAAFCYGLLWCLHLYMLL